MMSILETVWRTVPWAHAVHYCQGDVLVVVKEAHAEWRGWHPAALELFVKDALGPDVAVKVIVV